MMVMRRKARVRIVVEEWKLGLSLFEKGFLIVWVGGWLRRGRGRGRSGSGGKRKEKERVCLGGPAYGWMDGWMDVYDEFLAFVFFFFFFAE